MAVVWNEIKNLNMKSIKTTMRFVPPNFDQIYEYLDSLLFTKNNVDFDKVYSGRAWLCELFIDAQSKAKGFNFRAVILLSFVMSTSYEAAKWISYFLVEKTEFEKPPNYLVYTIPIIFVNTIFTF